MDPPFKGGVFIYGPSVNFFAYPERCGGDGPVLRCGCCGTSSSSESLEELPFKSSLELLAYSVPLRSFLLRDFLLDKEGLPGEEEGGLVIDAARPTLLTAFLLLSGVDGAE
jgi:hypothetical protein